MSLTRNSKMKLKRLTVLKLNQTSSSDIFYNTKHIRQAIKNSNKSSIPAPDHITVYLVENGGLQWRISLPYPSDANKLFSWVLPKTLGKGKQNLPKKQ